MTKAKVKAFIKYKEYRNFIFRNMFRSNITYIIFMAVILCIILLNSKNFVMLQRINQIEIAHNFSLEKFLFKDILN